LSGGAGAGGWGAEIEAPNNSACSKGGILINQRISPAHIHGVSLRHYAAIHPHTSYLCMGYAAQHPQKQAKKQMTLKSHHKYNYGIVAGKLCKLSMLFLKVRNNTAM
jgi:hypothetical protein